MASFSSSSITNATNAMKNYEGPSEDMDALYKSWMGKYPSALESFGTIKKHAKHKTIVVFLDYDGTLTPIVNKPELAVMSKDMRSAVQNVSKYFPTGIISGRSREKVQDFVGLEQLYYAGSHGMDIVGPKSKGLEVNLYQPPGAAEFLSIMNEVFKLFIESTKHLPRTEVEHNKFCVSVHYRNVEEKSWKEVEQCVKDILKKYPRLKLNHGHKVLKVKPVFNWNKGHAVEFLLKTLGLEDCAKVVPIYIGDDTTDEDAFEVLKNRGGHSILVSSIPKEESKAAYSLRNPSEVKDFLVTLVRWKMSVV